jgi:hypothetical protein
MSRRALITAAVLALACLVFASAAAAESRLYWSNNGNGTIGTAARAGTDVNEALFNASPGPFGIAADSSHVYWSDEGSDEIGRADLDGGNVEPSLIPAAAELPEGVAVDAEHVYWANLGKDSIGRANLDGSDPEPNFIQLANASFPEAVAIEGSHIYWTAPGHGGEIGRSNLQGGEVEEEFIGGLTGRVFAIAVNSTHIYWSESTAIGRASIGGGEVETGLVEGLGDVAGIALDNSHIYWSSFFGFIGRSNLDGGEADGEFITGPDDPDMIAVSQNATTISGGTSTTSVDAGEGVRAAATIAGAEETGGTITFALYGPGDQTCSGDPLETFAVTGNGGDSYDSPAVTPAAPGTYHWVISYSGDSVNEASATTCAGAFTVKASAAGGATSSESGAPRLGPLRLVKVTRNHATGIGHVRFHVPAAGRLTISGKGVKVDSAKASKAGNVVVTLVPKGAYKARLRTHRRGFTRLDVTFRPTSGPAIHTTRRVRLVKH